MAKQADSRPSNRSTPQVTGGEASSVGQAILGLLNSAANKVEANTRQALESAQTLSAQLNAAHGRIADLEAELRLYREKADRAEVWLSRISNEIENRLINQAQESQQSQRFH